MEQADKLSEKAVLVLLANLFLITVMLVEGSTLRSRTDGMDMISSAIGA
jgi:hypothetical protein